MSKVTAILASATIMVLIMLVGCGGSRDTPELAPVEGQVTLDGKPLPDVVVSFVPESGRGSLGFTDKNGKYKPIYLNNVVGVKLGKQKVVIDYSVDQEVPPEVLKTRQRIPAKYNVQTTLTTEIKPGKNVFNFELTTDETSSQHPAAAPQDLLPGSP